MAIKFMHPTLMAPTPGLINGLTGVTCAAARDCWAVGTYGAMGSEPVRNQALHWTGTKWKASRARRIRAATAKRTAAR